MPKPFFFLDFVTHVAPFGHTFCVLEPFLLGEWSMCNHSPKRNGLKDAPRGAKMGAGDSQVIFWGALGTPWHLFGHPGCSFWKNTPLFSLQRAHVLVRPNSYIVSAL